jgi:hypothetical protein
MGSMNPRKLRIPLGEWVEVRTTDGRSDTGWFLGADDEKLEIATTRQGFVASGSARLAFNADHIVGVRWDLPHDPLRRTAAPRKTRGIDNPIRPSERDDW